MRPSDLIARFLIRDRPEFNSEVSSERNPVARLLLLHVRLMSLSGSGGIQKIHLDPRRRRAMAIGLGFSRYQSENSWPMVMAVLVERNGKLFYPPDDWFLDLERRQIELRKKQIEWGSEGGKARRWSKPPQK